MNDFSVGDFAEQLLAQEERGPVAAPRASAPVQSFGDAPDLSHIEVPEDFVNRIVESNAGDASIPSALFPEGTPVVEDSQESEVVTLLSEVRDLLIEVKSQLNEVNTVGMGGVVQGGTPEEPNYTKKKSKKKKDLDEMETRLRSILNRKRTS